MKQHSFVKLLLVVLIALFVLPLGASAEDAAVQTTPLVTAQSGMVVAQEALAARIGVEILQEGGNAVDAAVAVGFAMAVSYPRAGNIGGGGFMVIHRAVGGEAVIDYRGDQRHIVPRCAGQCRSAKVARVRACHRRPRNGRGAGAGGSKIWLRPFHACRSDRAGDCAGARRHRSRRRHRGFAARRPAAACALAIVGENFSESRRRRAR
jgi:hypothetical protein